MKDTIFTHIESQVRSYCRSFPDIFTTAQGAIIQSASGKRYLDFLSGCGSLNYGHNDPYLTHALISHLESGGISMSLDMETASKNSFMETFKSLVLDPRGLDYRLQFTGPTGANAVEAAIKLARKVTGRTNVVAFTNAFHGCTLGALALTGSGHHRRSSQPMLNQVSRHPYCGYFGHHVDTAAYLEQMLQDASSGIDAPAAIVLEVIQGEGGLNVATTTWLRKIRKICDDIGALMIVDDIQAGCGRSGTFFSFEHTGILPDMVLLAKSISGYGQPMSLVLIRPEHDLWAPGEHNGTFRGNNLAFVTATAALQAYWSDQALMSDTARKAEIIRQALAEICRVHDLHPKGRSFMQGIEVGDAAWSDAIRKTCFDQGLIVEACGPTDSVVKLMPPLTIDDDHLMHGLDILSQSFAATRPAADWSQAAFPKSTHSALEMTQ